ncbi:MAG: phosphotransferase [Nitrospirae bacterium]|nr:phosphotransferase [Nitrospirota bacterium]MCL5977723.1 phosphotransferase [Nitrospirota bacterium]
MLNEDAIKAYLLKKFKDAVRIDITKLGAGVHGAGFLIEIQTPEGIKTYVIKGLFPEGLGHDYPSDRAQVFLLDLETYEGLPKHAKAVDVLSEMPDGSIKSIGGGKEYYLLMERVEGRDYFNDLREFSRKERLDNKDKEKIKAMTSYLAEIHSIKKDSRALYWRKLRDNIGHGECLMGVFDTYPDGVLSYEQIAEIEKLCVDWRARLKPKTHRLAQIHGDFHPGNIWFKDNADFVLLDRSRGPFGEPADDITALTINYIFFSIMYHGEVKGAYLEGFNLFFDEYAVKTNDNELLEVVAPFFAFRGAVVANPVFYPELTIEARKKIFGFVKNVLSADKFETKDISCYTKI